MAVNYKKDTVVYQIYPRSFQDSNGDGVGDIPGIISRLDYIASLGVNAIWLSPVYKSPNDDNGYDISDYKAIQPEFGTMEDFDRLLLEAKKRGIGIIMDLVINHSSDEHEWFRRALAGEEKYRDYYIIRKGEKGRLPNNWGNFFAECPWTPFGSSGDEYYLHLFSKKQPDLNWNNPVLQQEIMDIMRFWLEKGVMGFRCDVINIIHKNSLKNGRPSPILCGREHYISTEGCHRILRRLREEVLDPYGAFTVGETVMVDIPMAKELCDESRRELDMIFSFEHLECDQIGLKWFRIPLRPQKLMRALTKWQLGLDWNACYFECHDQPRFVSRLVGGEKHREQASKMMAGLQLSLRGTPFIYQGQEIGMTNGDFSSLEEIEDIESHNIDAMARRLHIPAFYRWRMMKGGSRDHARTPMQWSGGENAGFTEGKPWLKINANHKYINAESQQQKPDGALAFWKKMIALRKSDPALREGSFTPLYEGRAIYAFLRCHEGRELLCICNMSGKAQPLPKELELGGRCLVSSYDNGSGLLLPFEFRIQEIKK